MNGTLYIVSTPIGNLKDITLRAIEILKTVDIIYAEDTRTTKFLLQHLMIENKRIYSCHDHNESQKKIDIEQKLLQSYNVALVSDAGTPLICDPGYHIVSYLREKQYNIEPIPGVSAIITALSASGLPTDCFTFSGFLPAKEKAKLDILKSLDAKETTIFYESTHRIKHTLRLLSNVLPDRKVVIAKELTKKFETFFSGKSKDILDQFECNPVLYKGEFVLMIEGCSNLHKNALYGTAEMLLKDLIAVLPLKNATSIVASYTHIKKNDLYCLGLSLKDIKDV